MSIFEASSLSKLTGFADHWAPLAVVPRAAPDDLAALVERVMQTPFRVTGQVSKANAEDDIHQLLSGALSLEVTAHPDFTAWVADMAAICQTFCDILKEEAVGFTLGTERGCRRYHIDNVPLRLLVTYAGKGTEWLPNHAADRTAWQKGATNKEIVTDSSARQFIDLWDIALFRGGPDGLLHRTPDAALGRPSLQMRLDYASFWDTINLATQTFKTQQPQLA